MLQDYKTPTITQPMLFRFWINQSLPYPIHVIQSARQADMYRINFLSHWFHSVYVQTHDHPHRKSTNVLAIAGRDVAQVVQHSAVKVWILLHGGSILHGECIWRALFQNALSANPKIEVAMAMRKFGDHVLEKSSSQICIYAHLFICEKLFSKT